MTSIRGEDYEVSGKVSKAKVDWRVREDGALAHQLQEEEFSGHYSGNITRNRTVRTDIKTAKEVADEEALLAFKEEHEQVERNREIEERDRQAARQLYKQMLEEERSKIRSQKSVEDDDEDIARKIYENEKKKAAMVKAQQQATVHETDETDEDIAQRMQMLEAKRAQQRSQRHKTRMEENDQDIAKRLQAHEERKAAILRQRQQEKDAELARKLSQSERPSLPATPRSPSADINGIEQGTATMSILGEENAPEYPAPLPPKNSKRNSAPPPKYDPNYETPMEARAKPNRHERDTAVFAADDDDDRTNVEAEGMTDDAEFARRLQREEIKKSRKSRAKPELDDDEQKRLQHDERIARKMQHEEVMIAKNKYHKYKERVEDEIASPEPMSHVSRTNKTAVATDAKYDHGITLTDYKPAEGAQLKRHSENKPPGERHSYETSLPNVAAAIDPTFTKSDSGNVVLTHHRRSLNEGPPAGSQPGEKTRIEADVDESLQPVQGSRRKKEKETTKRKSIFSKLKKK